MAKKLLRNSMALLVAAAFLMAGCAESSKETEKKKKKNKNKDTEQTESIESEPEDTDESDASSDTTESESETSTEASTDTTASATDLYDGFMQGTVPVTIDYSRDKASYLCLSDYLEDGEAYTIKDIEVALASMDMQPQISIGPATYIDCGEDGVPELLATITADGPGDDFELSMIIKEFDGELRLCYACDAWSRSYVEVQDNGVIYGGGSGGAALHVSTEEYVDADGEYYFYFLRYEYFSAINLTTHENGNYEPVDFGKLDTEDFMVYEYRFTDDYLEENASYYTYLFYDETLGDYVAKDEDFDADNPYRQVMEKAGLPVYSQQEIAAMLMERAAEIGCPVADF